MTTTTDRDQLKANVKEKYGSAALRVVQGDTGGACCGSSGCCGATTETWDPITSNLYEKGQTAGVPAEALLASLGCGNPTALAQLNPGEIVLDLGSGGGIDVLLSAKRVGPTGKAYGLDMTDEMLALANENMRKAGAQNVEFLRGEIEHIPLPDNSVDVIISNCVINLSADKRQVLTEAFRVLKPGGRFAVSDVIVRGGVPAAVKKNMELWIGCVAGALEEQEFLSLLRDIGFENASIEPTRVYKSEDASAFLAGSGLDAETFAREIDGKFFSGFVRAMKPQAAPNAKSHAIRRATQSDLTAIERLLVESKLPTAGVRESIEHFIVAESSDVIIGAIGLEVFGDAALLRSAVVDSHSRSSGLGGELIRQVIALAAELGVEKLYLLTTTAENYFPRFGFVRTTRDAVPADVQNSAEFRGACPASAIVMSRERI